MDNVSKNNPLSPLMRHTSGKKKMYMADITDRVSNLQLNGPDMMVDDYEQYNNDRQEVVNISPDDPNEEAEPDIRADDCTLPRVVSKTASFHCHQITPPQCDAP